MKKSILFAACCILLGHCAKATKLSLDVVTASTGAEDVSSVQARSGDGSVHISWQLSEGNKGVSIRRSIDGFPFAITDGEGVYSGPATSFTDTDVELDLTYYYLLAAIDNDLNFAGGVELASSAFDYGFGTYLRDLNNGRIYDIVHHDGFLYTVGVITNLVTSYWYIEKRDVNTGLFDSGFGDNGSLTLTETEGGAPRSVATDGDYLYIGGETDNSSGANQWRLEKRSTSDGSLDSNFASGGVLTVTNSASTGEEITKVLVSAGILYIGGNDFVAGSNVRWRIQKRDATTGSLDVDFDGMMNGNDDLIIQPTGNTDTLTSMHLDGSHLFILGGEDDPSNRNWMVQKVDATTGSNVTAFDGTGVYITDPNTNQDDTPNVAVTDDTYIYIAGYGSPDIDEANWRIEKLNKTSAVVDIGFGTGGEVTEEHSNDNDKIYAMAADDNYLYVAGSDRSQTDAQWRIEKRYKSDGNLVSEFGNSGVITLQPNVASDSEITSLIIVDDYLVAAGYTELGDNNEYYHMEKRDLTTGERVTGELISVSDTE